MLAAGVCAGGGADFGITADMGSAITTGRAILPHGSVVSIVPEAVVVGDHRELEVRFVSNGTELVGTLFLPLHDGRYPAVVWVHSSGETERLHYGDIVMALLDANVALFSYDKRGVGESGGRCCPADDSDAGLDEFAEQADDALAALETVGAEPEIDATHVGFLGVSQAGWIVPIAATRSSDVAFTVVVSGPTVTTGEEALYSQLTDDADVRSDQVRAQLSTQLAEHGPSGFDPAPFLEQMTTPGLWLFGWADGSIPVPESVAILDTFKSEGKEFSYVVFPGAGHGLLDVNPPPPPEVIPTIIDWLDDTINAS